MRVVIFTGGVARPGGFTGQAIQTADLIIAADSGGRAAIDMGVFPSVVIGDLDSLDQDAKDILEHRGCQFITMNVEKDKTDTELALQYAIDQKASRITIIGGSEGDRLDHILANIFLVMDAKVPVKFVNGPTEAWLSKGPATVEIIGAQHDLLSLIPLTAKVSNVVTTHLKYPLLDEALNRNQTRGVSNVMVHGKATVFFAKGTLIFIHTTIS